eukprot:514965-Prorocentrum_minimum.AAC.2
MNHHWRTPPPIICKHHMPVSSPSVTLPGIACIGISLAPSQGSPALSQGSPAPNQRTPALIQGPPAPSQGFPALSQRSPALSRNLKLNKLDLPG